VTAVTCLFIVNKEKNKNKIKIKEILNQEKLIIKKEKC